MGYVGETQSVLEKQRKNDMKIVGYGICGGGEAGRYMRATLEEFARLCDDVIILGNNITNAERGLINEFGFRLVEDNREWGKMQWKIKQDFLSVHVARLKPDFCVCLDMDEVFCSHLTKKWIQEAPLDAYYCFFAELWNDEQHHKEKLGFWNVRMFRWRPHDLAFKQKALHCGLAPEWAYKYHRFAPFVVKHFGTMKREDRQKKIARYAKYDPDAKYLERDAYYKILDDDTAQPFDEAKMCGIIEAEVKTYQQSKPRTMSQPKEKKRFALVQNAAGAVYDIPEYTLADTLKQPGMKFVGWAEDAQKEVEELFDGVDVQDGAYQKSTDEIKADEKAQADKKDSEGEQTVEAPKPEKPARKPRAKKSK